MTNIEMKAEREDAVQFVKSASAKEGVAYKWVGDYAKDAWEFDNQIFDSLDSKADNIIRFLGGGTGLFALGLIVKADTSNVHLVLWAIPSFVLAILAIIFASFTKRATSIPSLLSPRRAKACAEEAKTEEMGIGLMVNHWHLACVKMDHSCIRKSHFLNRADWCFVGAIAALILPVAATVVWPPKVPSNQPASQVVKTEYGLTIHSSKTTPPQPEKQN